MKKILIYSFITLLTTQNIFAQNEISLFCVSKDLNNAEKNESKAALHKLNMQDCVNEAYKYRPSLKALKFAIQASKSEEKKAMADYFPKVTLKEQPYFATGMRNIQNSIALDASQLIYSFAGPLEQKRIAQKGTEISKLNEEQTKDLIRYEVETNFLQSWLLQRKNKLIESLKNSSIQNIKKAENQNTVNLLGQNDWLIAASDFSQNQATVHLFVDELGVAQSRLEFLIGKKFNDEDNSILLEWDSGEKIELKDLDLYKDKAMQNRKEIKHKQKEIEQQYEYQNYYKKTYLPSVKLVGRTGRSDQLSGFASVSNAIGLSIDWQFSDGGANFHESQKANANKLKAMMEKQEITKQVINDVQVAYYELAQLLKTLVAQNVTVTQAKNEYELNKLRFKIGDISKVDFETSEYNWQNQEFIWLTTKINAAIKKQQLLFVCGYPKDV